MGARTENTVQDETSPDTSADFVVTYANGVTRRVWGEDAAIREVEAFGGDYAHADAEDKPKRKR